MNSFTELASRHCTALPKGTPPLPADEIARLLTAVSDWEYFADDRLLRKNFTFPDYGSTMAFVNAVAWIAQREDHHPDMQVGFNHCQLSFSTHSVGGISMNDFICAAKIDTVLGDVRPSHAVTTRPARC